MNSIEDAEVPTKHLLTAYTLTYSLQPENV